VAPSGDGVAVTPTALRAALDHLARAGYDDVFTGAVPAAEVEPFVVSGPWALGSDGSVQQSGIAVNQLVSGGSRGITYTLKDSARSAGSVTGTLGMSYFDSKYDLFANKIWFVNCSGAESFEAVPAG